jgi:hypothetical protein
MKPDNRTDRPFKITHPIEPTVNTTNIKPRQNEDALSDDNKIRAVGFLERVYTEEWFLSMSRDH